MCNLNNNNKKGSKMAVEYMAAVVSFTQGKKKMELQLKQRTINLNNQHKTN